MIEIKNKDGVVIYTVESGAKLSPEWRAMLKVSGVLK